MCLGQYEKNEELKHFAMPSLPKYHFNVLKVEKRIWLLVVDYLAFSVSEKKNK